MHKSILKIVALLLCMLILVICGCQSKPKEIKKELLLCSSLDEKTTRILAEGFQRKSNVKVTIEYLPGGSLETRLKFLTSKNFDCWLGGTAEEYNIAGQQKLLQRYIAKDYYRVPVELRNKQGDWTPLYLSHIALISNKELLREKGVYAPQTWDELLAPAFKDELAIPDFKLGGASFGMLTSIWQLKGKNSALQYAMNFNRQHPIYTGSVAEAVDLVYKGEKTVAVIPVGYALILESQHKHLFATVVKDANRNMLSGAAVLRTTQNEQQAQGFLDYLMSEEGTNALSENGLRYLWHVTQNPYKDGREDLIGKVQVPVDDLNWTATYKDEIIRQWLEMK